MEDGYAPQTRHFGPQLSTSGHGQWTRTTEEAKTPTFWPTGPPQSGLSPLGPIVVGYNLCVSLCSSSTQQRRATYGSLFYSSSVLCCFVLYSYSGFVLYSCSVFVLVTEVAGLCLWVVLCHTYILSTSLQQSVQFSAIHLTVLWAHV